MGSITLTPKPRRGRGPRDAPMPRARAVRLLTTRALSLALIAVAVTRARAQVRDTVGPRIDTLMPKLDTAAPKIDTTLAFDTSQTAIREFIAQLAESVGAGSEYTGHGPDGVPHYAQRPFTEQERALLRQVYGIEDPSRLYLSDSSDEALLKYDTAVKRCASCLVNSYVVGFASVRNPGESWEQLEQRVRSMRPGDFSSSSRLINRSTADLDPDVREVVDQMLADARRAGFALRVMETYRSPEREAYLMAASRGSTHTLTSLHAYGRALDILVDDGNVSHKATRTHWIAFRRWVTAYKDSTFRILGAADKTWDWAHVEVPSADIGFRTIESALARAQACSADGAKSTTCDFVPNRPAAKVGAK